MVGPFAYAHYNEVEGTRKQWWSTLNSTKYISSPLCDENLPVGYYTGLRVLDDEHTSNAIHFP